jgi:ATP-dependent RNA helicase RhlE
VIPIRKIVQKLAARRQNLFFSATMPKEIGRLADELLIDPAKVSVAPVATTAERVDQRVILIEAGKKRALLTELFADAAMSRTLVFTRTKRGADRVAQHLEKAGIKVAAIHGNKSQRQREEALAAFKVGKIRGLIATDIAARGIDIDLVTHVVNFELPNVPESYVHRIGRTARAGAEGIAISLCANDERGLLKDIEKLTRQVIPSTDRRNDATLAVDSSAGRSEDRPDSRRGFGGGGDRGGRSDGRSGNRNGGGGGYRANDDRPRSQPRSERSDAPAGGWRPALDADRPADRPARAERTGEIGQVAFLARPNRDAAHKPGGGNTVRRPEGRDQSRGASGGDRRPAGGGQRSGERRDGRKSY